ncbi:hypothetical protein BDV41DRAFT_543133 [Aspergillus transmontanensis]|uniref:Uncharacterized protein n=1 Tax=Aspergillus transmontanensis TaxID=1034304 RepID=A0A5N6VRW7_9EURO|nr:hypothetical protein BDV41DRAFT_543133 [Aspergillus transmontanensis]
MDSLQKTVHQEGEGSSPRFGDQVIFFFKELKADGQIIHMQEPHLTFPASGDTFTVLHAVVGVENRLGEHRMAILQQGFNFFLDSITSMRKGEIAEFYVKDLDNTGDKQSECSLFVELKDFYPLPAGYAPAHVGYNPRPENSQENAARPYLDLQSFGR